MLVMPPAGTMGARSGEVESVEVEAVLWDDMDDEERMVSSRGCDVHKEINIINYL